MGAPRLTQVCALGAMLPEHTLRVILNHPGFHAPSGFCEPAGRPPTRRPRARQRLIEELKARPDMPDYLIADRGLQLGVWTSDQAQDPANRQRRIKRIREDAAN